MGRLRLPTTVAAFSALLLLVFAAHALAPHAHALPGSHDHQLCAGELGESRNADSVHHYEPCLQCRLGRFRMLAPACDALPSAAAASFGLAPELGIRPVASGIALDREAPRAPPHTSLLFS